MKKINKINQQTLKLYNDIIFVRHAEAIRNDSISNDLLPLTKLGIEQAKEVSKMLENQFDVIISSSSKRAIMTAEIISNGQAIIQDERLLERGWGKKEHYGQETEEEAKIRIANFLKEIVEKYKDKRILIVTHGALIKIAQNIVENNILERERVNNCTTIKYTKDKEKKILKS